MRASYPNNFRNKRKSIQFLKHGPIKLVTQNYQKIKLLKQYQQ